MEEQPTPARGATPPRGANEPAPLGPVDPQASSKIEAVSPIDTLSDPIPPFAFEPQSDKTAEGSMGSADPPRRTSAGRPEPPVGAGFLRRVLAFTIDLMLLNFLYLILSLFGVLGRQLATDTSLFSSSSLMSSVAPFISAWVLLFIGYFTFFHAAEGQTPGKKVLRIKAVNREGVLLPHWVALLRSCGYFLSFSFLGFGFLMSMFGKKRCLHDWLTGAYVVLSAD